MLRSFVRSAVLVIHCGPLGALLASCGDTVKIVVCPPGTVPQGSRCLTPDVPDVTAPEDTVADVTTHDGAVVPEDSAPESAVTDTAPAEIDIAAPRATGAACGKNADCAGGTCLDWTDGYCTRLDCDMAPCEGGAACVPFANNHLCASLCQSDAECRFPHQACKALATEASLERVCIGVVDGAGGVGSSCADATECAGGASCLASFPGGYCASLGCDLVACPSNAACVDVDGRPSCLLRCVSDVDCGGQAGAERRCGVLRGLAGSPVEVCISGIEGRALGETCSSDFECTTGTCQILGEGRCSQTGGPCFAASVAVDCNGAEFCQVTATSQVGVCSQPCALGGGTCPGASHCLAETDDPRETWCRPACSGPGDLSCNATAGLVCAFGVPLSDSGQGRYACTRKTAGSALASCIGAATCAGGGCLGAGGTGYCTQTCGEDSHCAFAGACVLGEKDECYRACVSIEDCPSGFACASIAGSNREVCVP